MADSRAGVLFTFRLIPMIAAELTRRGIDARALVLDAGLPGEALTGEITAPLERITKLVDAAARALGSEQFGLDLAEQIPSGAYGVSAFLMRSAPDIATALGTLCDFAALINPIGHFRLVLDARGAQLHYAVGAKRDGLGTHLNEYTVAFLVRQLSSVLDRPMPVQRAWFAHARRSGADAVVRRFGCEVAFGAADCGFAVTPEVLAWTPRTADPALFEFLLAQARAQLTRLGPGDVVAQVVRVLEVRLASGDVAAPAIAAAMATTVRSLQRRLGEAGTTYREVLAHVRLRRAGELRQGGLGETAIARSLGFSDASSMRRSLSPSR